MVVSEEFSSNMDEMVETCVLRGNQAHTSGGGIYVNASSVSINDFLISDNISPIGGKKSRLVVFIIINILMSISAGLYSTKSLLNLSSVTVNGNLGGGLHSLNSSVILISSKFSNNSDSFGYPRGVDRGGEEEGRGRGKKIEGD
jgi:predicted outer membrane repeat protein